MMYQNYSCHVYTCSWHCNGLECIAKILGWPNFRMSEPSTLKASKYFNKRLYTLPHYSMIINVMVTKHNTVMLITYKTLCHCRRGMVFRIHPSKTLTSSLPASCWGFSNVITPWLPQIRYFLINSNLSQDGTEFPLNSSFVRAFPFDHLNTLHGGLSSNYNPTMNPCTGQMYYCPVAPKVTVAPCPNWSVYIIGPPQAAGSISWMHACTVATDRHVLHCLAWVWRSLATDRHVLHCDPLAWVCMALAEIIHPV